MTLHQFKEEFRFVNTDTWGDAMDAWFECTGHLNVRKMDIPSEWEYSPGLGGNGTDPDSYWHPLMALCTNDELNGIGAFLFRYCQFLRHKATDY